MKQLSIFDEVKKEVEKLDPLTKYIEEYLELYHFGETDPIPMKKLADIFNLTPRALRKHVSDIRTNGTYYIVGSIKGYYAVNKGEHIDNKMKNKTVNSMRRLVKANPNVINLLYAELNDIKKELVTNA